MGHFHQKQYNFHWLSDHNTPRRKDHKMFIHLSVCVLVSELKFCKIELTVHLKQCECHTLLPIFINNAKSLASIDFRHWLHVPHFWHNHRPFCSRVPLYFPGRVGDTRKEHRQHIRHLSWQKPPDESCIWM